MKPTYRLPEPTLLWTRFFELVCVPRPSKEETPAIDFLQRWAKGLGFDARRDAVGNLSVHVPATNKSPANATVILQCHVDIVSVTAPDGEEHGADASRGLIPTVRGDLDPSNDKRLKANESGDWIGAPFTTLGADNGIGVAMMMGLAESDQRPVPLELLFTIDEEAGMSGAGGLDRQALGLTGKLLINIDTEDDTEITIGAAGGRDAQLQWKGTSEKWSGAATYMLSIDGLKGGHSGVEINQGRANANRLVARALQRLSSELGARLVSLRGGSRRNAIPDNCQAGIALDKKYEPRAQQLLKELSDQFNQLYGDRDNKVAFGLATTSDSVQSCLSTDSTRVISSLLLAIPTGICEMTPEIPTLVESSCNMAIVEMNDASAVQIVCSVRGTTRQALDDICDSLMGVAQLAGASIQFGEGYPGWKPHLDSPLLKTAVEQYRQVFKAEPKVHAIHAGLECGLLIEKMPQLQAISIGPTIKGNHAVGERVQISSVEKSYRFLTTILGHLAESVK